MTTRTDAYNFFLNSLSERLVKLLKALDNTELGSVQHSKLTAEMTELQRLLAALDDIANAVK
jgi:predicted metal-dependent peptidase